MFHGVFLDIFHIRSECEEYCVEHCEFHRTSLWICIMLRRVDGFDTVSSSGLLTSRRI